MTVEIADSCQGFVFTAYRPGPDGRPEPAPETPETRAAEDIFLQKVNWMLRGRPDLLDTLGCIEGSLEVHLHYGTGFLDEGDHGYFYGRVTEEADSLVLEVATDEILQGGRSGHEVLDVVIHEVTHVLDLLDDRPMGDLPGWDDEERAQFEALRALERAAIEAGTSALDSYALTDDREFLAVLVETFFVLPEELRHSSPGLFSLLHAYFDVDPVAEAATMPLMRPVVV